MAGPLVLLYEISIVIGAFIQRKRQIERGELEKAAHK
jgi:Sec-independent protein secretion pathway component TatC